MIQVMYALKKEKLHKFRADTFSLLDFQQTPLMVLLMKALVILVQQMVA